MALKTPFMDEVNKATYDEMGGGGRSFRKDPKHQQVLARYRQSLRRATRFSIDDDTVRFICQLTKLPKMMELNSILARIPFEVMWIEFDMHVKIREWERMGTLRERFEPSEVSKVCGYLIQKDLDSDTRWVAVEFIHDESVRRVLTQSNDFVFDPNGSALRPVTGSTLWNEVTLSKRPGFPKIPLQIGNGGGGGISPDDPEFLMDAEFCVMGDLGLRNVTDPDGTEHAVPFVPDWVRHKVGLVPNALWKYAMRPDHLDKLLVEDATERCGGLRWLMCALAAINDLPRVTKAVHARQGRAQTRIGPIKYLDHHTITLRLPKRNEVRWATRELTKAAVAAHRAWHPVRGHWRNVEYGKKMPYLCRHEPTEVEGDYALCSRCERLIKWVEFPTGRGDPRLGIISHDYEVTT